MQYRSNDTETTNIQVVINYSAARVRLGGRYSTPGGADRRLHRGAGGEQPVKPLRLRVQPSAPAGDPESGAGKVRASHRRRDLRAHGEQPPSCLAAPPP